MCSRESGHSVNSVYSIQKKRPKMLQTPAFRVKSTGGIYPDTQISIVVRRVQTGSRKLILGQCRRYALETVCRVAHPHRAACREVTVRYSQLFHKRLSTVAVSD